MKSMLKYILRYEHARKLQRLIEQLRYHSFDVFKFRAYVGNNKIASAIQSQCPAAIGKIGAVELNALRAYLRSRKKSTCRELTANHRKLLMESAGVYPGNYDFFEKWSQILADLGFAGDDTFGNMVPV